MPADPLTPPTHNDPFSLGAGVPATEQMILRLLAASPPDAGIEDGLVSTELATAAEIYRQAGLAALTARTASPWWQIHLEYADWNTAEKTAAGHLTPLLERAEADNVISSWWFIRKHPCWRLRLRTGSQSLAMKDRIAAALDGLAAKGLIRRWWSGIYEAETAAFGGSPAMDAAHDLFATDSRAIMAMLRSDHPGLGRRELSVIMCGIMLRAASLEWYEQGDVWDRVARKRPLPADVAPQQLLRLSDNVTTLIRADIASEGPLFATSGPLHYATAWAHAFHRTGNTLSALSRAGTLQRGLREILSYHIIFHWNRLGLPTRQQAILAASARTAILGPPTDQTPARAKPAPSPPAHADTLDRAMTRFPLVPHARLRCPDLPTRIRHLTDHVEAARHSTGIEDRIDRACSALNLAALIAADCAMPSYAAQLCRQQFELFRAAWPPHGRTAIASLQPLVNLSRLEGRAGHHDAMFHTLDQLNRAVLDGGTAAIHGTAIDFDGFTTTHGDGALVRSWLQNVLRHDGTRALAAAGHWKRAATHAAHYDTAHRHLREHRQTRIIALSVNRNAASADTLLDTSLIKEPWENAVAACLRAHLSARCGRPDHTDLATMVAELLAAGESPGQSRPSTTIFRTRLGLTAVELALTLGRDVADLTRTIVEEALRSLDAYACQEVLAHARCRSLITPPQAESLDATVEQAALGRGSIPPPLSDELSSCVNTAMTVLKHVLHKSRH